MKLKASLCLSLVPAAFYSLSSQAEIRWLERDYDFGLFKEIAGPKTGTSRFVNLGPDTLSILAVKPSCGCTSADFTRSPLAPGDTAVVTYTYDPTMRPGKFEKSVRVTLSDGSRPVIHIAGNVLGTPESLATLYPVEAGAMRLSDGFINLGDVKFGRKPIAFVNAYVLSADSITPALASVTQALTLEPSIEKAGPGDVVTFTLNFDANAYGKYGPVEIPVFLPGDSDASTLFMVRARVLPDATDLSLHQQGKSPEIVIVPDPLDLGPISGSEPVETQITVKNVGKGTLELLNVSARSEAVELIKVPQSIKPGKSAAVKLRIDPSKLARGPQRIPVEVICNDPYHITRTINIAIP